MAAVLPHLNSRQAEVLAVCRHSQSYPGPLLHLADPPPVIYVRGSRKCLSWLERPCVTVVGARKASSYGIEVARSLACGLASAGLTVVSGMAYGVDSAAHEGALDAVGGQTVGVLAGGVDRPYPRGKRALYEEICKRGLVLAEMPPGFVPQKWSFPARNRIMAALGAMTVVVEAGERSGSLITADFAKDLGRDVGAVPGAVNSRLAHGPNALIADGARVVRNAQDVLDEVCGVGVRRADVVAEGAVSEPLRTLLECIETGRNTVDRIATSSNEAASVLAGLSELELLGLVRRASDGRYLRQVAASPRQGGPPRV